MKDKKILKVLLILLLCAGVGFGGYFYAKQTLEVDCSEEVEEEEPTEVEETECPKCEECKDPREDYYNNKNHDNDLEYGFINDMVTINYKKCLNSSNVYTPFSNLQSRGLDMSLAGDKKTVNLKINPYMLSVMENMGTVNTKVVGINSNVKKMFSGYIGFENSEKTLYFLTEDGSIYYVKLFTNTDKGTKLAYNQNTKQYTAKKMSTHLSGIVGFANTYGTPKGSDTGGGSIVAAVKSDGSFYDLSKVK